MYVDASCRHPKLASVRTVGWAVVDSCGHERGGVLPPGSTVAYGEALAIVEAYHQCEGNTVIWSDCQAAVKLWRRCLRAGAKRYAGALQGVLPIFQAARRRLPGVQVMWIPSHLTKEEFVGAWGIGLHAWAGNQAADEAAKQRAGIGLVTEELVARVLAHQSRAAEVAHVVASVQLQRLQQRIRTEGGHAVKARKRKAPGGLRRMHVPGAKRACLRREERLERCLRDLDARSES